jgi:hypothetical protein
MASLERPPTIDAVSDAETPRRYPKLTEAQKQRILSELLQEYRLDNLRPVREAEDTASPDNAL